MKSELLSEENEDRSKERKYPYLGISDAEVVLFVGPKEGVVIHKIADSHNHVGGYSTWWSELTYFKPLPVGTKIILSN